MQFIFIVIVVVGCVWSCNAFNAFKSSFATAIAINRKASAVSMGLFDFLNPNKPTASARHILVKGANGPKFLTELKTKLNAAKNVENAFADAAAQYSSCPSSNRGGDLGNFKQGQMVRLQMLEYYEYCGHFLHAYTSKSAYSEYMTVTLLSRLIPHAHSILTTQQVPAFDKVVFNDEVGKIHGPVITPFGAHLILISARST